MSAEFNSLPDRSRIIWVETTTQHFTGDDESGLFRSKKNASCMTSPVKGRGNMNAANWRNEHLQELVRNGSFPKLPVIRVFEESNNYWFLHDFKHRDCVHYCYWPPRFFSIWKQLANIIHNHSK